MLLKVAFALACSGAFCLAQEIILPPADRPVSSVEPRAPYVIRPMDILSINVVNRRELSGMLDVHPNGMISMPLIGEVNAEGLTTAQLRDAERLKEFISAPMVSVQVVKSRKAN